MCILCGCSCCGLCVRLYACLCVVADFVFLHSLSSFCPRGIRGDAEQFHTLQHRQVQHHARRARKGRVQIQLSPIASIHPLRARKCAACVVIICINSYSARETVGHFEQQFTVCPRDKVFRRAAALEFRCDPYPFTTFHFLIFGAFPLGGNVFAVYEEVRSSSIPRNTITYNTFVLFVPLLLFECCWPFLSC